MGAFEWKPAWPEIVRQQEETLRYGEFSRAMALELGLKIRELAAEQYHGAAAIRILEDGMVVFAFKMAGTSGENDWWMDRKLAVSRMTGVSSILTLVEVAEGLRPMEPEFENENDFALCGGCFPLRNGSGKLLGYALCSGLAHECDHQLIADALAELLGREIPRIVD